jgi:hypothetical protein
MGGGNMYMENKCSWPQILTILQKEILVQSSLLTPASFFSVRMNTYLHTVKTSAVDPDPAGLASFWRIQIRRYPSQPNVNLIILFPENFNILCRVSDPDPH